jgi:hypothetical protein
MLPFYKIVLNEENEGWDFMGFVENPAHMKPLMVFSEQSKTVDKTYYFHEDEQIIMGVAIATNLPIYRNDKELGEYNVFFDKEQTRKIGQKMLKSGFMHNVNEQHNPEGVLNNIQLDTLFYIDKKRGVHSPDVFKGQNLQDGSMIVSYKIEGKENWEEAKRKVASGEIGGLSIEGWFDQVPVNIKGQKKQHNKMNKENNKPSLWSRIFGEEKKEEETEVAMMEVETTDGVVIKWEGELAVDTAVFIMDEEGNDIQAPEGTMSFVNDADGSTVVLAIDGNGLVTSMEVEEATDEDPDAEMEEVVTEMNKQFASLNSRFTELETKFQTTEKENGELKTELEKSKAVFEKLVDELDNPERLVAKKESKTVLSAKEILLRQRGDYKGK